MSIQTIPAGAGSVANTVAATARAPHAAGSPEQAAVPAELAAIATARAPDSQLHPQPANPAASQIDQALDEVRKAIAPVAQELMFSVDDDTGRAVIKIIDSSTDEVIKQIPSEEILAIAKALDKLQGLLVRQEV